MESPRELLNTAAGSNLLLLRQFAPKYELETGETK